MPERFWSDDFDMDLLKLFPDLPERLGEMAEVRLWVHGGESYGRLNHPSVWHDHEYMVAFFGLAPDATGKPGAYWTSDPVVECTWLETLRDEWPHQYTIVVGRRPVLRATRWETFGALMCDLRGHHPLPDAERERLRREVLARAGEATRFRRTSLNSPDGAEERFVDATWRMRQMEAWAVWDVLAESDELLGQVMALDAEGT